MTDLVSLRLLSELDAAEIKAFEQDNRAFFAQWIADRGDDYFFNFGVRHHSLVRENHTGESLLYVVRGIDGRVVGRVNITDIHDEDVTELGYRISKDAQGRGFATSVVKEALAQARTLGVQTVRARTTTPQHLTLCVEWRPERNAA